MNDYEANHSLGDQQRLEQLVEEFTAQIRSGQQPSITEYQRRHPQLRQQLQELLSSVAMIEGLKRQSDSSQPMTANRLNDVFKLDRLGDYRIVRELGRGGMGIVLEAVHESLGRRVAIKVLPSRLIDDERYVERFRREAQAAATLHHTNIVGVFGVGESQGFHYYVMEYVNGCGLNQVLHSTRGSTNKGAGPTQIDQTIRVKHRTATVGPGRASVSPSSDKAGDQHIDFQLSHSTDNSYRLSPQIPAGNDRYRWAAEKAAQIADALAYAHQTGKLHRDIKPSNLLLDREGHIWLTDFGLVKNVVNQTLTKTGDIIGTPQYMAPESFEGQYDCRSETYCLGLTLFEMVTSRPAFEDGPAPELIRKITTASPVAPQKINAQVPRDLDTIIQKATARDPCRRYQTARSLRDDLRSFLDNRPIEARRASAPERLWRWTRRNPWAAISAVLVGLIALTASIGYVVNSHALRDLSIQHVKLEEQKARTDAALEMAQDNANKTRIQFERAESNVALAMEMFDSMFKQTVFGGSADGMEFAFDGFQELSGIEIAVTAREAQFLENMLIFYEKFAEQNSDNTDLRLESARAYRRVANIYHVIGKMEQAEASYGEALKLFESLATKFPDSVAVAIETASTRNEFASALLQKGDFRSAMEELRTSRTELDSSTRRLNAEIQLQMAKTLNLMGSARPVNPRDTGVRNAGPGGRRNDNATGGRRGSFNRVSGARDSSLIHQGVVILDQLIASEPDRADLQLERAKSYGRLAELQFSNGEFTRASQSKRMAIDDLEPLVEGQPENSAYKYVLAQLYAMPYGEPAESKKISLEQSLSLVNELVEKSSRNLDFRQLEAEINAKLGKLELDAGKLNEAVPYFSTAADALGIVVKETPMNRQIQFKWSLIISQLAELLIKDEKWEKARDLLEAAIRDVRRQARENQRPAVNRMAIVRHYQLLAQVLEQLGDSRGARQAGRQSRQILTQQNPGRK